jgi:hypothetical protein
VFPNLADHAIQVLVHLVLRNEKRLQRQGRSGKGSWGASFEKKCGAGRSMRATNCMGVGKHECIKLCATESVVIK